MKVTAVVPTYNRGPRLRETVRRLLATDVHALSGLEVIVVDDGSSPPAEESLQGLAAQGAATLTMLRQPNAGPARARNTGFRAAKGEIVAFIDDDILVPSDLMSAHVLAHRERPGCVVFGRCPWVPPVAPDAVFRFLQSLGYDGGERASQAFLEVPVLASGQISVERSMFGSDGGVYRDDLVTPAAEEYELALRLRHRGVPILLATKLIALHDSGTTIAAFCRQQYKHGVGCAEVAERCPDALQLSELANVIRSNERARILGGGVRDHAKSMASSPMGRSLILHLARLAEYLQPQADGFRPLYQLAVATHFLGGVRDGVRRFRHVS